MGIKTIEMTIEDLAGFVAKCLDVSKVTLSGVCTDTVFARVYNEEISSNIKYEHLSSDEDFYNIMIKYSHNKDVVKSKFVEIYEFDPINYVINGGAIIISGFDE